MIKAHKFKKTEIGMVPDDWEVVKIDSVGKVITGKTPPTKDKDNYGNEKLFVKIPDFGSSVYIRDTTTKLSSKGAEYMRRLKVSKDSVMVSCIASVGEVGIVSEDCFTNQQINSLIPNKEKIKSKWIYYFFKNYKDYLKSNGGGGSVYTNISKSKFQNLSISLPSLEEQERISKILFDLDSKIELLQKQNETLEKIGQAIFKHWFVDFEFPNEEGKPYKSSGGKMVESELGEIPEGWSVGKLGDIAKENKKSINPAKNGEILFDYYSFSSYDNSQYPDPVKGNDILSNKFIVKPNCILFSKLNLNYPKIWFIGENIGNQSISSTEFIHVMPDDRNKIEFIYYFLSRSSTISRIKAFAKGTSSSHQRISPKDLFTLLIPLNKKIIQEFSKHLNDILIKYNKNIKSIKSLEKTRDLLLPKLMTGKIRVPLEVEE